MEYLTSLVSPSSPGEPAPRPERSFNQQRRSQSLGSADQSPNGARRKKNKKKKKKNKSWTGAGRQSPPAIAIESAVAVAVSESDVEAGRREPSQSREPAREEPAREEPARHFWPARARALEPLSPASTSPLSPTATATLSALGRAAGSHVLLRQASSARRDSRQEPGGASAAAHKGRYASMTSFQILRQVLWFAAARRTGRGGRRPAGGARARARRFTAACWVAGGLLYWCEHDHEAAARRADGRTRDEIAGRFGAIAAALEAHGDAATAEDARALARQVRSRLDLRDPDLPEDWSMPGALFFVATVVTTIGYGNFAPVTTAGKVATVGVAVVGIAWFGYLLAVVGEAIQEGVLRASVLWRRVARRPPPADPMAGYLAKIFYWNLAYVAALALGAFALDYTTVGNGLYMALITFTTVGLGDYAPPFNDRDTTLTETSLVCCAFAVLCCLGLGLLSALLNAAALTAERRVIDVSILAGPLTTDGSADGASLASAGSGPARGAAPDPRVGGPRVA